MIGFYLEFRTSFSRQKRSKQHSLKTYPRDKSPGYFRVVPAGHEKTLVSFLSDDDCPVVLYDEDRTIQT